MPNYNLTEAYGCTFVSYEPEEAARTTYHVYDDDGNELPPLHSHKAAVERAMDVCAESRTWSSMKEVHHFPSGLTQEGEWVSFSFNEVTNKVEVVK